MKGTRFALSELRGFTQIPAEKGNKCIFIWTVAQIVNKRSTLKVRSRYYLLCSLITLAMQIRQEVPA